MGLSNTPGAAYGQPGASAGMGSQQNAFGPQSQAGPPQSSQTTGGGTALSDQPDSQPALQYGDTALGSTHEPIGQQPPLGAPTDNPLAGRSG